MITKTLKRLDYGLDTFLQLYDFVTRKVFRSVNRVTSFLPSGSERVKTSTCSAWIFCYTFRVGRSSVFQVEKKKIVKIRGHQKTHWGLFRLHEGFRQEQRWTVKSVGSQRSGVVPKTRTVGHDRTLTLETCQTLKKE